MAARKRINSPSAHEADLHYLDQCKYALEPSVVKLIEMAVDVGWKRQKALHALMFLAAEMSRMDAGDP